MYLIINPERQRLKQKKRFSVSFMGFIVSFTLGIDGLAQDCSNSIANAMELQHSCTKSRLCQMKGREACLSRIPVDVDHVDVDVDVSPRYVLCFQEDVLLGFLLFTLCLD